MLTGGLQIVAPSTASGQAGSRPAAQAQRGGGCEAVPIQSQQGKFDDDIQEMILVSTSPTFNQVPRAVTEPMYEQMVLEDEIRRQIRRERRIVEMQVCDCVSWE